MARPADGLQEGTSLPPYRVRARNTAAASANRIHDDTVAAGYGFRGGLVPGVTVYAYMTHPVVEAFGIEWLGRGSASVRFLDPVYDGDLITVSATVAPAASDESATVLTLEAHDESGRLCATGRASLPNGACDAPPVLDGYPFALLPDAPPPVSEAALAAIDVLGTVESAIDAAMQAEYRAKVDDDLALYAEHGVAHPAQYLELANHTLASNVLLNPWMHVSSEIRHHSLLRDGETASLRGRVADLFERRGHQFVDLDLLLIANGERPVASILHRSIYRIRPKDER